jgi:hypothetical protein
VFRTAQGAGFPGGPVPALGVAACGLLGVWAAAVWRVGGLAVGAVRGTFSAQAHGAGLAAGWRGAAHAVLRNYSATQMPRLAVGCRGSSQAGRQCVLSRALRVRELAGCTPSRWSVLSSRCEVLARQPVRRFSVRCRSVIRQGYVG